MKIMTISENELHDLGFPYDVIGNHFDKHEVIFEWIVRQGTVTYRCFISNRIITGFF